MIETNQSRPSHHRHHHRHHMVQRNLRMQNRISCRKMIETMHGNRQKKDKNSQQKKGKISQMIKTGYDNPTKRMT